MDNYNLKAPTDPVWELAGKTKCASGHRFHASRASLFTAVLMRKLSGISTFTIIFPMEVN